jgi:nicotinate-nucleotide pyrophosphorylase (carboxylating)
MQNIRDYAKEQPDIISVGFLTHSPKAVDFSLEII